MTEETNDIFGLGATVEETPETPETPIIEEGVKVEVVPPAPVEQPSEKTVPIQALLDERNKRQEADRERELLQEELRQLKQPKAPTAQPLTDDEFFESPSAALEKVRHEVRMETWNQHLALSESMLREIKPDAGEKIDAFAEACKENPALYQAMTTQPNPALFAYKQGEKHLLSKQVLQDPEAFKAQIRAEILAEMNGAKKAPPISAPQTLTDTTNLTVNSNAYEEEDDFKSLFKK